MQARAKEAAFYKGIRLRAGQVFECEGAMPKWAAPAKAAFTPKAAPGGADTKSKATQEAVKAKTNPSGLV